MVTREEERTERGDRAETDTAQGRAETGKPYDAHNGQNARTAPTNGYSSTERGDQDHSNEGGDCRDERNRAKSAGFIECGSERRTDSKAGEHRRPHPGNHLPCIVRADTGQSPYRGTCDDKALGP